MNEQLDQTGDGDQDEQRHGGQPDLHDGGFAIGSQDVQQVRMIVWPLRLGANRCPRVREGLSDSRNQRGPPGLRPDRHSPTQRERQRRSKDLHNEVGRVLPRCDVVHCGGEGRRSGAHGKRRCCPPRLHHPPPPTQSVRTSWQQTPVTGLRRRQTVLGPAAGSRDPALDSGGTNGSWNRHGGFRGHARLNPG